MFLLYVIVPNIFERWFFFNEIFAGIGILLFLQKPIIWRRNDAIYNLMIFFISLGFIHIITSAFRHESLLAYFRHWSIVYSGFSFFLGILFFQYRTIIFKTLEKWLQYFIFAVGLIPNIFDRAFYSVGIAFFRFSNHFSLFIISLIAINLYIVFIYDVATPGFVVIVLLGILFIRKLAYFQLILLISVISFAVFYLSFLPNFALVVKPASFVGVIHSHPVLQIDHNTTFRFGLWYEILFIDWWKNIFGIGFGTQLFKYTRMPPESGKIAYFVSGAHNTYITLFSRLGVLFLGFFLLLYRHIIGFYFRHRRELFENKSIIFFIAFFCLTVVGFFNLVLESPILASGYWTILGMVYGSMQAIKSKNTSPA
jgi:hypothetical protein